MDIALFQAIAPVPGTLRRILPAGEGRFQLILDLDRKVDAIFRAEVGGREVELIELHGPTQVSLYTQRIPGGDVRGLQISLYSVADLGNPGPRPIPGFFGLGPRPGRAGGAALAIQTAVRTLRMGPGTDLWNPERGGGLVNLQASQRADPSGAARVVALAVDRFNSYAAANPSPSAGGYRVSSMEVQRVQLMDARDADAALLQPPTVEGRGGEVAASGERVVSISLRVILEQPGGSRSAGVAFLE